MTSNKSPSSTPPPKLEIISLGLARTGSRSMSQALKTLGFDPVYHSIEATFHRPQDVSVWYSLVQKKFHRHERITKQDLDRATAGLRAVTSAPYWAFWGELMEAYPDAKIILVEREYEKWMLSFVPIIETFVYSWRGWVLEWVVQPVLGRRDMALMAENMKGYFDARTLDQLKANSRRVHHDHHEGIRKLAKEKKMQFLDYQLGEGWEPLCAFLGVEVPEGVEFPRGNERGVLVQGIKKGVRGQIWQAVGVVGRWTLTVGVVGVAVWWAVVRR